MTDPAAPPAPEQLLALSRQSRTREVLRLAFVWTVALGLLAYLALTTNLAEVWGAVRAVDPVLLGLVTLVFVVGAYVLDAWCLVVLFRGRAAGLGLRELLRVKGASYLLNVVNYNAATAAIALFLRKRAGVPLLVSVSSLLLLNVVDLAALNVLLSAGLAMNPGGMDAALRHTLLGVNLSLYAVFAGTLLYWNAGFDLLVLGRLRTLGIFSAFREARLTDWGRLLVWRLGLLCLYSVHTVILMRLFDMPVPFEVVLATNPIVALVGILPISVSGIGTTQVAMRQLFGAWGSVARIDAFSTTMIFLGQIVRLVIAWVCLAGRGRKPFEVPAPWQSPGP